MRTSMIAMIAVLGLAGWQIQGTARADTSHLLRTAYEDTVQRYHSGESLQQSTAPQRVPPLADGANATGVDNARLADAGDMSGVDNAKLAEAATWSVSTMPSSPTPVIWSGSTTRSWRMRAT